MPRQSLFPITVGEPTTASQIIAASNYDYKNPYITDLNFPLESCGIRGIVIELIQVSQTKDYNLILKEVVVTRANLSMPTYECALKFGLEYPEEQRHMGNIVFLHEPWACSDGGRGVIVLYGSPKNRSLGLDWFRYGSDSRSCFGFIRHTPVLSVV